MFKGGFSEVDDEVEAGIDIEKFGEKETHIAEVISLRGFWFLSAKQALNAVDSA